MSHVGDGTADVIEAAAAQATAYLGLRGSTVNPSSQTSRPPSIHGSISSEDSNSSDEGEGEDFEAKRRRKEKMKANVEKKAKKLTKKRIKKESEKHPFFGLHKISHNYASSQYPSSQFQSVHLRKPSFFDGMDYLQWSYNMKMHLYGLHPSIWKVVVVGVTPPMNGVPMSE
jgi:hypothetical protein